LSDLPPAWIEAPLSLACHRITDGTHHSPVNLPVGDFKYVTAKNVRPWGLDLSDISFVDAKTHREIYARCPVEKGDVLYIKDGATTGLAIVNPLEEPFSMLSSVALIKPNKDILDSGYLKYWLNSPSTHKSMLGQMTGTAIRRLTLTTIASQTIPLPPLAEQGRIAALVDSLSARTGRARTELARVPILVARYKQRLLALALSGELTAQWREAQGLAHPVEFALSDVARGFSYGSSAKSAPVGEVPVLRMGNIQDGKLDWKNLVFTSDEAEIAKYRLVAGDVLFNRTNSRELVGKTALYRGEQPAIYAGYLIRIQCTDRLLPEFLTYCLNGPAGRAYCWEVKTDGVSQSNINAKKIAAFRFLVPTRDEQAEIVRRIDSAFSWLDRVAADHAGAAKLLPKLDGAILAKAFRGELVPQDPADAPASVLPERTAGPSDAAKRARGRPAKHVGRTDQLGPQVPPSEVPTTPLSATPLAPKDSSMSKSRHDPDVLGKPYLAKILRKHRGVATVEALFKVADLPVADFYKQLAWETENNHIRETPDNFEAA